MIRIQKRRQGIRSILLFEVSVSQNCVYMKSLAVTTFTLICISMVWMPSPKMGKLRVCLTAMSYFSSIELLIYYIWSKYVGFHVLDRPGKSELKKTNSRKRRKKKQSFKVTFWWFLKSASAHSKNEPYTLHP